MYIKSMHGYSNLGSHLNKDSYKFTEGFKYLVLFNFERNMLLLKQKIEEKNDFHITDYDYVKTTMNLITLPHQDLHFHLSDQVSQANFRNTPFCDIGSLDTVFVAPGLLEAEDEALDEPNDARLASETCSDRFTSIVPADPMFNLDTPPETPEPAALFPNVLVFFSQIVS